MTKQTLNLGTVANDGNGDPIRTGGDKINDNFDEVFIGANSFRLISRTTTAEPGSPADGDCYLLPVSSTGTNWAGQDGKIAYYSSQRTAWVFLTALEGYTAWVNDEDTSITYDGTSWLGIVAPVPENALRVVAATTAAGTLATDFENADTLDGVTLATDDLVLIKDQAAGAENGVYKVNASGAPTRYEEADTEEELLGLLVVVTGGTVNDDKLFQMTTNAPLTVDTTALTFTEFSGGGGGSALEVQDEAVSLSTAVTKINFAGAGVTATEPVADEILVTIPGVEAGGAGGGIVYTPTAAASVDIELGNGQFYEIDYYLEPANDAVSLEGQVTNDGFTSVETGSVYSYYDDRRGTGGVAVSSSDSDTKMIFQNPVGNAVGEFCSGTIKVYRPAVASVHTSFSCLGTRKNATTEQNMDQMVGTYEVAETINGIRLAFSAGNMTGYIVVREPHGGGGTFMVPVNASAMKSRTTNGAATGSVETTTNKIMVETLDFDDTTDEFAQFQVPMPESWDEGTLTAEFIWTSGAASGDVIFGIQAVAIGNDDALDAAFGTAVTVTDTALAADDLMHSPTTSAFTVGGTPAAKDTVIFQVYRDADAGGDTLTGDVKLLGVRLYMTTNAADDS